MIPYEKLNEEELERLQEIDDCRKETEYWLRQLEREKRRLRKVEPDRPDKVQL